LQVILGWQDPAIVEGTQPYRQLKQILGEEGLQVAQGALQAGTQVKEEVS